MSSDDSNPDKEMLKNFKEFYYINPVSRVSDILNQYFATNKCALPALLALLFEFQNTIPVTSLQVADAISQVENQSNNPAARITEVSIALHQFDQPSVDELANLFKELCHCCNRVLIVDLIKLIHQYLCANVQHVFTGMQLYVFDTAKRWELAEITQILWMPDRDQYFIYVVFDGWATKWNEWIPVDSVRLHWLKSKQGQLLGRLPTIDNLNLQLGEWLDYFNLNGHWERAEIISINEQRIGIILADKTRLTNCRPRSFAPYHTFT